MYLDAHVVDHADDVFDLLRIDDVVRQVIVDFGVRQVALLLALDDQGLDLGLLLLIVFDGHECSGGSIRAEERKYRSRVKGDFRGLEADVKAASGGLARRPAIPAA